MVEIPMLVDQLVAAAVAGLAHAYVLIALVGLLVWWRASR